MHTDNLECLSDVNIASKKLFLIQGDRPQLLNWERYGLRIGVSGGSLSSTETAEVAVVTLVGGQFVFPKNTVLVSAMYAVSISRPLLKALRLEMQHCVDLLRGAKTKYIKFAIAPVSTASLSYEFSIVDGGEFREEEEEQEGEGNRGDHNGWNENGGDHEEEEGGEGQEQGAGTMEEKEKEGKEDEKNGDGVQEREGGETEEGKQETKGQHTLQGEERDNDKEKPSTGVSKAITYSGITYYEQDGVEDLLTFTAAKKLNALLEFAQNYHKESKMGQNITFRIKDDQEYIELVLDHIPQDDPFTGWKIKPHVKPSRLYKEDIVNFGGVEYPLPPTCLISVYGSPAPGVVHPVTIFIHRSLRNTPHPSSASATTAVQTGAQASPSVSTDQHVHQPSLDPQLAVKAFRKQFGALSKLLSVSCNRLAVAPELFSEGLITFDCYRNATEGSSKTEEEKSTALMISLMSTISTQPELLTELINVLNRIEPFKLLATKLVEASYH
uniref:Uncharacterized protein n=1 Tax=Amphimedon queenslandica TaxID=400682 RepID=A0A1X7UU21_AMPQE